MPAEAGSLGMSRLPDTWLQGLLCGQLNCIHLGGKGNIRAPSWGRLVPVK